MHHTGLFRHNYFPIGLIKELLKCRHASLKIFKAKLSKHFHNPTCSSVYFQTRIRKSSFNVVTPFQNPRGEEKKDKSLAK